VVTVTPGVARQVDNELRKRGERSIWRVSWPGSRADASGKAVHKGIAVMRVRCRSLLERYGGGRAARCGNRRKCRL